MMHPLTVLGDRVRRSLIDHLAEGEQSAGDLSRRAGEAFGIGASAVSQHLAVLKEAGFAEMRPSGRSRIYRLRPQGFQAAQVWLDRYRPFWAAAMDRLGEELDRAAEEEE